MSGPLEGVRIVELTSVVLGPWAAQMLGDMGADVIKIEPPGGDTTRNIGPARNPGMAALFLNCNRNKRSIVLDLKNPDALAACLKLLETADVLVHNLRPQVVTRLGLAYEAVKAVNPEIIYCATYGYRKTGPNAEKPAYDDIIQAASGLAAMEGIKHGAPNYLPAVVCDKTTAMTVVYAICAALFRRERHGGGQAIEVPMFENMVAYVMSEHLFGHTFEPAEGEFGYGRVLSHHRRPYATRDGYVAVLPHTDAHWRAVLKLADRSELLDDPRFATVAARTENIDALYAELEAIVATRTTAEWLRDLDAVGVPCNAVNTLQDLIDHPQLKQSGFWQDVEHPTEGQLRMTSPVVGFAETPSAIRLPPPRLGQHSLEVLREAGLDDAAIDGLLSSGATSQP